MDNNIINNKICITCKKIKSLLDFHKNKCTKDGYQCRCKKCRNIIESEKNRIRVNNYYKNNPNKYLIRTKNYKIKNKDYYKKYYANYFQINKNKKYQQFKIWRKNNPNKIKEYTKIASIKYKYKKIKYNQKYFQKNKHKINIKNKIKYHTDINKRINSFMKTSIKYSLKNQKNGKSWKYFVDYDENKLKNHLQSQFTEGMTWEKFLNAEIVIDHILPIKLFDFKNINDPQLKICWGLNNLKPMWYKDNLRKNDFLPNGQRASLMSSDEKINYLKSLGYNIN